MKAARAVRRIGGSVVLGAALAGAVASPATAMTAPACATRLAAAEVGASAYCTFDTQYDWAALAVVPATGTLTAGLRCVTNFGYVYETSRAVEKTSYWISWTPGSCTLTLTSRAPLTTAHGSATPTMAPIVGPYPYPTP